MKRTIKIGFIALLMLSMFMGCQSDSPEDSPKVTVSRMAIELDSKTRATAYDLVDYYRRFTIDMVEYVDNKEDIKDKNVVVSPLSAAMVLAIAANGVDETSQHNYMEYLGVNDIECLNSYSRILLDRLPESDNTSLFRMENSIWVNKDSNLKLSERYASEMSSDYSCDIFYQDFSDVNASVDALNKWCAANTGSRISNHFENLDPNVLAVILNAVCFKGRWVDNLFNKSDTKEDIFHGLKGDGKAYMMESGFNESLYSEYDGFEFFSLKFGNGAFSLDIILPPAAETSARLDLAKIKQLLGSSYETSVKVYMPRFNISGNGDISGMLESIGRGGLNVAKLIMFTSLRDGVISYRQSASFSVDESGAVAASVTSGTIMSGAAVSNGHKQKVVVKVDRPFYFFISEFSTRACILSGRVADI